MWIKICGNTTLEDARFAAECGADAVGFVFAQSLRRVTVDQVREITLRLPKQVEKIGVFVDAGFSQIERAVLDCDLTGVQLHASFDLGLAIRLRDRFAALPAGGRMKILQVLHFGPGFDEQIDNLRSGTAADAVLVDSRTAKVEGGTGVAFDWQAARRSFSSVGSRLRLIAAGGLKPENVGEAIETLQPWGVDVSSGVEASPGRKDPERVRAFVDAARNAMQKVKVKA